MLSVSSKNDIMELKLNLTLKNDQTCMSLMIKSIEKKQYND